MTTFWRAVLIGGFTFLALILFLPSTPAEKHLPAFWADNVNKIVLGLDLQGGMHLVLKVDRDEAVENYTQRMADNIEAFLKKEGVSYAVVEREGTDRVRVVAKSLEDKGAVANVIGTEFPIFDSDGGEGNVLLYKLQAVEVQRIKTWATTPAIGTIRNRIDKFGVAEPVVQKQGVDEILVQLPGLSVSIVERGGMVYKCKKSHSSDSTSEPGVGTRWEAFWEVTKSDDVDVEDGWDKDASYVDGKDVERVRELIKNAAILEFKLIDETSSPEDALRGVVPFGSEILYEDIRDSSTGKVIDRHPYVVKKETIISGDLLTDARVAFDPQFNEPYVAITFNSTGGKIFERITAANVGNRLAVVLDGKIHSAPVIRERIGGGRASISGNFTHNTATDLAIVLRAGALPATMKEIQNVTVGPSLGRDSIEAGINAVMLGGLLVVAFMVFYYRLSGVIANCALLLNLIMLLGAMAWFNATLTLPGIAGIILTIGMGVDSNVLIFERIKEELRAGRTPRSAVDAGFERAWWTIIDAHVTTLITAVVLFQFGSGPIKGFAVTLSLGILINLYTAFMGTKFAFDIMNTNFRVKRLSI